MICNQCKKEIDTGTQEYDMYMGQNYHQRCINTLALLYIQRKADDEDY